MLERQYVGMKKVKLRPENTGQVASNSATIILRECSIYANG